MEEKKQIKIKLSTAIIIACVIIILTSIVIYTSIIKINNKNFESDTVSLKTHDNQEYYIIENDYLGEYDLQCMDLLEYYDLDNNTESDFEKQTVMDYSEYESYCKKWGIQQKYSETSENYIIFSYMALSSSSLEARLAEVKYEEDTVSLYVWDNRNGFIYSKPAYVIIVPTDKNIKNVNIIPTYTKEEFKNIKKYGEPNDPSLVTVDKPIIYLYPTEEEEVSVKLLNEQSITHSYPKYNNGWKVLASPDGNLKDLNTGRNLYSLYYENTSNIEFNVQKDGFIVKGQDATEFLEEKLEILGLTEREAEEFIIYWLPKLENNKYNYIRFATTEEINANMPLEINPNPDTIIRVLMTFKGLDNPIEVEEQKLISPERTGFVAVEWGGTEIK